jgi:hypothetical protein
MWVFKCLLVAVILVAVKANPEQPPAALRNLPRFPETRVSNLPQPQHVKLYDNIAGLVEPVLIPGETPPLSSECKGTKDSGSVTLSFIVDAEGRPRNVVFKHALANQIDLLALQILLDSKFQPAILNGSPVAVGLDVEMHLQVCIEQKPGTTNELVRLRSLEAERFIDWRHAPVDANLAPIPMPADALADAETPGPGFTTPKTLAHQMLDAKGMSGFFSFGELVDEHGLGHIEKVLVSTNPNLLPIAAKMIQNIRRTPALKDGMPVPVHVTESLDINSQN